jgi:hypothetical protein
MNFEKELSKKMFIKTNEIKNWNLKLFSKWVKENKDEKDENWIKEMNFFFYNSNLSVRLVFVTHLEFCVIYEK